MMEMNKCIMLLATASVATLAFAQQGSRNDFLGQQAYDEARRVASQVDMIQNNVDSHESRIGKLERGNGSSEVAALKARIAALEATVAELRSRQERMRAEIVNDIVARINKQMPKQPTTKPAASIGPHREYAVKSGDTLSLIAEAFGTTVPTIKQMNGLKSDTLRVGQKLKVPLEK